MSERNQRKVREGIVVGNKADKTIIVKVQRQGVHPRYDKIVRFNKKYYAHDEKNECVVGDTVKIIETRPLSKMKRWRLGEVVVKAK